LTRNHPAEIELDEKEANLGRKKRNKQNRTEKLGTSPALRGVKMRSGEKPLSRA